MTWQDITIEQFQTVYRIMNDGAYDDFEKEIQICALLSGKTEASIEALDLDEYKKLKQKIDFVFGKIPGGGKRIKGWGNYRFIYDVRSIGPGRFITLQHFLKRGDMVQNLHQLAACIIEPGWYLFGQWRPKKYNAHDHDKYATDMLNAPFLAMYHSMVFFCNLYNITSRALTPFLEAQAKARNIPMEEIEKGLIHLSSISVGSFGPKE